MKTLHVCEVCDLSEELTPDEAFNQGWDYPPHIGQPQIISPRTCGNCTIEKTLWWALVVEKKDVSTLDARHLATLQRIQEENPYS